MLYRPLTRNEYAAAQQLDALGFFYPYDAMGIEEELEEPEDPPELKSLWGALDDRGDLAAKLALTPRQMTFRRSTIALATVGAVVTHPSYRRQGVMASLLRESLRAAARAGASFAALLPFSVPYYRRFDFVCAFARQQVNVALADLATGACSGSGRLYHPGDGQQADIRAVYEDFAGRYNLMLRREPSHWREALHCQPEQMGQYLYLWYDSQGQPKAYARIQDDADNPKTLLATEFCFVDLEGCRGMLHFLGNLGGIRQRLRICLPPPATAMGCLNDLTDARITQTHPVMARMISVPGALAAMPAPDDSGRVVLEVADGYLPENTGRYQVCWERGQLGVQPSQQEPDIALSVGALTHLALGSLTLEQVAGLPDVSLHHQADRLEALFSPCLCEMMDNF
ncbi:MAG: GNAT family N-acetyltransferase [Christensenellales bacterium]|jgi:predicted acetyltransferase